MTDTLSPADKEALLFHSGSRPGKIAIIATKPMATQRDLSLAYSPGVAAPVHAIAHDANAAYDYTSKGNMVAVISNGTAILGLGNLGPLASKPVMEGKAVLFKRFADVDAIDLEIETEDVDEFINCVRYLGPGFGGINLEDIKAPECFIIEQRLRELMNIPVFHDDQHGTAIITAAALINALFLSKRKLENTKIVVNGAGSASIACIELIKRMGLPHNNAILCDSKGVIYKGRLEGMNQWKSAHAVETDKRSLAEAMHGADVFLGLSVKGAVSGEMVASMAPRPIIFAMANPDPEITPEEVLSVRSDAIIATGRSDYDNQVNNVLGFPYIFRGALDVRAYTINDEMKIAAAEALAKLAREDVPDEVCAAYGGRRLQFGDNYIIPVPFDHRLLSYIPAAVAKAAMDSGVARLPISDIQAYRDELSARLDPMLNILSKVFDNVRSKPRRIIFAEGEERKTIRAALAFRKAGYGTPILVGRRRQIQEAWADMGLSTNDDIEIYTAQNQDTSQYLEHVYKRMQRKGFLLRDCIRLVNNDRNVFAACLVAAKVADGMVTGLTRHYGRVLEDVSKAIDPMAGHKVFGLSLLLINEKVVFIADTAVDDQPSAAGLAEIAVQTAQFISRLGYVPHVAFCASSSFGNPVRQLPDNVRGAIAILDERKVFFEYDGDMTVDVALNPAIMANYPFCRLSAPANVLIMPSLDAASIATKMMRELSGAAVFGPILIGLEHSVQIVSMGANVSEIVNAAAMAAYIVK